MRVSTDEQSLEVVFVAVGTGLCPLKVFNQKDILLFGRSTSQKARCSDTGPCRPFKHLLGPILTFVEDSCYFSGKFTTYMRNSFSSDVFRPMRGLDFQQEKRDFSLLQSAQIDPGAHPFS